MATYRLEKRCTSCTLPLTDVNSTGLCQDCKPIYYRHCSRCGVLSKPRTEPFECFDCKNVEVNIMYVPQVLPLENVPEFIPRDPSHRAQKRFNIRRTIKRVQREGCRYVINKEHRQKRYLKLGWGCRCGVIFGGWDYHEWEMAHRKHQLDVLRTMADRVGVEFPNEPLSLLPL